MALLNMMGDFLHRTSHADLPEAVIDCAKLRVIDFLSAAFSGYRSGLHRPLLRAHQGSAGTRQATLIAEGAKMSWPHAALVNSSMCPADMADGSRFASLHPSPIVIPAALATFEAHASRGKGPTGRDLLTAIVLGYELMIRVGQAMNPSAVKRGFHLTSIVGPLASAAVAGKIMNLDASRLKNALSIAGTLGGGLFDAFKAPEPFVEIQIARACESGMFAASMAGEGVRGNDEILEKAFIPAHSDEYHLECLSDNLSNPCKISQTYIKIHGGCRHLHTPIDAALAIVGDHNIHWDDIGRIAVKTYSIAKALDIENPETGDDARFNMTFGIAVAIIRGNALPGQFTTENLKDKSIRELMKKVVVETSPGLDRGYPAKRGAVVEVTTKGGETFSQAMDIARGEPEFPVTRGEIEEKFRTLSMGLISETQAARALKFIDELEDRKDLRDLFASLKAGKDR